MKNMLHNINKKTTTIITKVLLLVIICLLFSVKGFGVTYYWVGGTTSADFGAATSWSTTLGGVAAAATYTNANTFIIDGSDISSTAGLQTGTVTINMTAARTIGQFILQNNANAILLGTANRILTVGGAIAGNDFSISSGCTLSMNGATFGVSIVFAGTGNTGNIAGTLTFGGSTSNLVTTTGGTSTLVTVASSGIVNLGAAAVSLVGSTATLSFANGSNCNASGALTTAPPVPLATWGTSSNLTISGITSSTTAPTNAAQTFGNVTYNCPAATGTMSFFTTNTVTIKGNLRIQATNTGRFRCVTTGTLNVLGNMTVEGASICDIANGAGTVNVTGDFTHSSTGTTTIGASGGNFNVSGTFAVSAGTIDLASSATSATINIAGTFNQTGGTITESSSSTASKINFNGTTSQSVTVIAANITNSVNFIVSNPAGIAITGTLPLNAGTTFTAASSGTAITSGAVTYSTTTTLAYITAVGTQITGNEFPATSGPVNLTINNTGATPEVSLNGARTVTGTLTITAGIILLGNNDLTLANLGIQTITTPGTTKMIVTNGTGLYKRGIPATTGTYLFPIGDNTGTIQYTPVSLQFTANSVIRIIGAKVIDGVSANINSGMTPVNYLSRYWTFSENGAGGTYNYYINPAVAITGAEDEVGTAASIKAAFWNGSVWTQSTNTYSTGSLVSAAAGVSQAVAPLGSVEWTGRDNTVICATPTAQPTSLLLSSVTSTGLSASFTPASPAPSGYLVIRSTSSSLSSNPVDGTTYVAGNTIGGGTVVQSGTTTTFTEAALTANTTYYYYIFSYNNTACTGGPKYLTTSPLTANALTCPVVPAGISCAVVSSTSLSASWTASAGATTYYYEIDNSPTFDGVWDEMNGSTSSTTVTFSGLTASTTYYIHVAAVNSGWAWSGNSNTSGCTTPCAPPSTQATIDAYTNNTTGTTLTSNWTRGNGTGGVIVVARLTSTTGVAPTSGTAYTANAAFGSGSTTGTGNFVVYNGTGTTVNITGLIQGTSYTFSIYEYNTTSLCYNTIGSSSAITTYSLPSINIPLSGSNSVTCGTSTMIYDNGGSSAVYAAGSDGYTVLNNAGTGVITITGTYYTESNYDFINIYSGSAGSAGALLWGPYSSSTTGTVFPTYTSSPGQTISIRFNSDASVQYDGFALTAIYSGSCVLPAPTITSFSPSSGCQGSSVIITGTNFLGITGVTFGGVAAASYVVNSTSQITTVPASTATGTIAVTNSGGTGTSASTFTIPLLPVAAGTITGTATVCQGVSGVSYSVPAITNATSYTWAYSGTGATITGTSTSVTIAFSASATSGNLTVMGTNSCGNGTVSAAYAITVIPTVVAATTPSPATAATGVCYAGGGAVSSVSWSAAAGATSYDVYFGAGSLPGTITSTVTTTSYSTGTLLAGTTYYWKVVPINSCGNYGSPVTWTFTTTSGPCALVYCASAATTTADEEIYSVTINGATNAYNCTTVAPGPGSILSEYSNFTTLGSLTTLIQGNTIPFSISEDECDGATYYSNGCAIWIDYNQDGDFADAGEQVFVESATTISPRTISGSFVVPGTSTVGTTRMRIIVAESTSGSSLTPCLSYGYGETEDYSITISASIPCSGTPSPGNTIASVYSVASGGTTNLSLQNSTIGTGLTYQWQSSFNNSTWSNISGANATTYTATVTISTYYRCLVTCSAGPSTGTSNSALINCEMVVPLTGNNSYTVCSGNLYDAGGSTGNYDINWNGYTVLYPSTTGALMRVSGTIAGESCCDYLYIYNGVGTSGTLLWSGYAGIGTVPVTTSSDPSGALTISFISDGSVVGSGFNLSLSCLIPPAIPGPPTSNSPNCGSVTITRNGTAPSGETWYWQTSATAINTSSSGSTYTVSSSGTYYIRSYRSSDGEWSIAASIFVVVNTAPSAVSVTPSSVTICDGNIQTLSASGGSIPASGYSFSSSNGAFSALTGATTVATIQTDDAISAAIPIGFTFNYSGSTYTNVYVSSNGFLSFNASAGSALSNSLSTPGTTEIPVIAPLWDDLDGAAAGTASYLTAGTAGNRVFTFEWLNWEWNYTANAAVISFQVKLYENNGKVEFIYRQDGTAVSSGSASIGITGLTSGNFLSLNSTGTSPTSSSISETTNLSSKPSTGQIYSFLPPQFTWSPTTGLYTNSGATTAYTSTATTTVYAKPSATITYSATATSSGCTSSGTSTITVNTLSTAPTSITGTNSICDGGSTTLTANGGTLGTAATYQWYAGGCGTGSVLGTNSTLTVSPISTTDYFVRISGTCNTSTCASTTVTVYPVPSITTQPNPISECMGATNTLSITASGGTPSLTYQWYSNVANNNTSGSLISGATSSIYTPPSSTSGTHYYYCIVSASGNACGSTTSNAVSVFIPNTLVTGTHNTTALSVCVGYNPAALTISAPTSGMAPYTYQWQLNGVNISGETSLSYDAPIIGTAGTYSYSCITTDACGNSVSSSPKVITVLPDPSISSQPVASSTVCPNNLLSISIVGSGGTPSLTYQWFSNITASTSGGTLITGETNSSYSVPTTTSGTYYFYCVISAAGSGCNSITSNLSTVIVSPGIPATPGAIMGSTSQCPETTGQTYSIAAVNNATTYNWSIPTGWIITSGAGTNSITVTIGTVGQNGNITVSAGNSCGNSATSSIAVISSPDIWLGTVNHDWSNINNWSCGIPTSISNVEIYSNAPNMPVVDLDGNSPAVCNNIAINSGASLTIAPYKAITIFGSLTNNSGTSGLILQSDIYGTASLIHNTNSVSATVQRYISGNSEDWHFLSSPVAAQGISGSWLPSGTYGNGTGYDLYLWNEPNNCWIYKNNTTTTINWNTVHPGTNFEVGRGYLYSVQVQNPTKEFIGNLNNSTQNCSLSNLGTNINLKGFNLIGNPYPSSIDWQAASGWSRSNLTSSGGGYDMWIWNPTANNYGVCNSSSGGGTNGISRYIAPMQGYFVLASNTGNISVNNSVRVHNGASNWKDQNLELNSVSVVINSDQGNGFDEAVINFGSTGTIDGAYKMFSKVETAPSLYLPLNGSIYSVENLTNTNEYTSVPLSFKSGTEGEYTLNCQFDQSSFGTVMLEDKLIANVQNMKQNNVYHFSSKTKDNENRFVLHFGPDLNNNSGELPAIIYSYNNSVFIDLSLIKDATDVRIYTMLGELIYQSKLQGTSLNTIKFNIPPQNLNVNIFNAIGCKYKKVSIFNK